MSTKHDLGQSFREITSYISRLRSSRVKLEDYDKLEAKVVSFLDKCKRLIIARIQEQKQIALREERRG